MSYTTEQVQAILNCGVDRGPGTVEEYETHLREQGEWPDASPYDGTLVAVNIVYEIADVIKELKLTEEQIDNELAIVVPTKAAVGVIAQDGRPLVIMTHPAMSVYFTDYWREIKDAALSS